jgi:hypothetical protein
MTLVKETERFECRHLQETIKDCLPSVAFVEESFLIDRRHEKILFLYIEIYKPTVNPVAQMSSNKEMYSYSINEIKSLKQKLPIKLIRHIETVIHPIFMPRNEEEILRNIIVLANQIKYIRDLPQLSIHYEKQTDTHLFFTVILVRLKLKNSICLDKLFSNIEEPTKINIEEIRIAGYLKKKHPKEAAILHICIEKESFFRSDYSIDLLKARQRISSELMTVLGEFRDFNGGMIIQQDQAISHLRQIITPLTPYIELLLANYFYSIRPMIMQTIHDRIVLKTHFEMLLQIKENKLKNKPYLIHHKKINNFYFYWIQAIAPTFKDSVISETGSYANELTHSFLQIDQDSMLGFILREGDEIINNFHQMLSKTMERWGESTLCPVNLIAQL